MRVYEKDGDPRTVHAVNLLEQQRKQMISTLTNKVIDNDTEIEKDFSFYEDMVLDNMWS